MGQDYETFEARRYELAFLVSRCFLGNQLGALVLSSALRSRCGSIIDSTIALLYQPKSSPKRSVLVRQNRAVQGGLQF
jgi:hypothetical protein